MLLHCRISALSRLSSSPFTKKRKQTVCKTSQLLNVHRVRPIIRGEQNEIIDHRSILIPPGRRSLVHSTRGYEEERRKKKEERREQGDGAFRAGGRRGREKRGREAYGTEGSPVDFSPSVGLGFIHDVYLPYGIRCRYIMVKLLLVEASIGAQLLVSREIIEIMGPG